MGIIGEHLSNDVDLFMNISQVVIEENLVLQPRISILMIWGMYFKGWQ